MRLLFLKIIVFFSLVSCSNINFLLDTKESSNSLRFKQKHNKKTNKKTHKNKPKKRRKKIPITEKKCKRHKQNKKQT